MSDVVLPDRVEGDGFVLRRLRADDAAPLVTAFRDDPELGRLLGFDEDPDEAWVRGRLGRAYELVIADPESDAFLGMVLLHSYDERHRRCEAAFWLILGARGRGLGTAVVTQVVAWAFRELDLLRVEITTTVGNDAVHALAARLGFTREGVAAQAQHRTGRPRRRGVLRRAARGVAGRLIGVYGRVLRTPGVPRLVAAFLAAGTAVTMTPVALVLFARDATQSFAIASLVLAAQVTGNLVLSPIRGRLVDRIGARRAVIRIAVPSVCADALFIVAGHAKAADAVLVVLAFVAGAITPPTGASVRGMWTDVLGSERAQVGFALMTVMQEATFFVGPLLAGGLVGLWSPTAAVAATAAISLTGALIFASAPAPGARGPQPRPTRRLAALAEPGARTVLATAPAFGLAIGILDVTLPAFARAHGSTAASGVLLSAFAAGVGVGGFAYGLHPWRISAGAAFPRLCLLAALGMAPLIAVSSLALMIPAVFLAGLCFAPITTCFLAVIDEVSAPEHRTETFTWMGSLNGAGLALGAVIAGQLLTAANIHVAIAASCAATALTFVIASARAPTLTPART